MDESKSIDSKESGEYEDDFEKDLEWLINDKEKSNDGIIEVCVNRRSARDSHIWQVLHHLEGFPLMVSQLNSAVFS